MPSAALLKFENNLLGEVNRLIKSHRDLNHDGYGRRGLGHITRSGVLMLCAAWELYVEELLMESVKCFRDRLATPKELPKEVQKELSKHVKDSKHELKPLELAGDGWESLYMNHTTQTVELLNTPKSENLNILFRRFLGVKELSDQWSLGSKIIDDFVKARGDIAHRGRDTRYVTINKLNEYKTQVIQTILETDNFLADHLRDHTVGGSPWRRRRI